MKNTKIIQWISLVMVVLGCASVLWMLDLSDIPAFRNIILCHPDDLYLSALYKLILSVTVISPMFATFAVGPTYPFSDIKHIWSSFFLFLFAFMCLFIGVPVREADGMAVVFVNIFCKSSVGAFFVLLMIAFGGFLCFFYFYYSCKCFFLLRTKER